jgi:hypothetical protein
MVKALILCATLGASTSTLAQSAAIISFTAEQVGEKVLLQFTFSKGHTCSDTRIQRADSSLAFATIGVIPGVCGSSESEESYTFIDSFPIHGEINAYRISLAGLSYSDTLSLEVVPARSGQLLLFPNPTADVIRISLPTMATRTIELWNDQGHLLLATETTEAFLALDLRSYSPGPYLVRAAEQGRTVYSATFIKL